MTKDVLKQYRMHLNTFEQGKRPFARFKFDPKHEGKDHNGEWVSRVTVTWISDGLAEYIPIGTWRESSAPQLTDARDAASKKMIDLFAEYGVRPKTGN